MGKFLSTGLLAATGAAAGAGQALGEVAKQYTERTNKMDLAALTHQYEMEKVRLADELAGAQAEKQRAWEGGQKEADRGTTIVAEGMKHAAKAEELTKTITSAEKLHREEWGVRSKYYEKNISVALKQLQSSENIEAARTQNAIILQNMVNGQRTNEQIREYGNQVIQENTKFGHELQRMAYEVAQRRKDNATKFGMDQIAAQQGFAYESVLRSLDNQTRLAVQNNASEAAKAIKNLELGSVDAYKIDDTGKMHIFNQRGEELAAPPGFQDVRFPLDRKEQDAALIGALLKSANTVQDEILKRRESGEDASSLEAVLAHREEWLQRLTGKSMGLKGLAKHDAPADHAAKAPAATDAEAPGVLDDLRSAIPNLPTGPSVIEQRRQGQAAPPAKLTLPQGVPQPPMIRRGLADDNRIP